MSGNYLRGYAYTDVIGRRDVTRSNVQIGGSAGAIISTLDDMATFQRALMDGKLLAPQQLKELTTTVPTSSADETWGLGIAHMKTPCGTWAWGHNGAVLGYFSEWLISDDGSTQVVHANNEYHMQAPTKGQTDSYQAMGDAFCAA